MVVDPPYLYAENESQSAAGSNRAALFYRSLARITVAFAATGGPVKTL
jgi:hypothetical protein